MDMVALMKTTEEMVRLYVSMSRRCSSVAVTFCAAVPRPKSSRMEYMKNDQMMLHRPYCSCPR